VLVVIDEGTIDLVDCAPFSRRCLLFGRPADEPLERDDASSGHFSELELEADTADATDEMVHIPIAFFLLVSYVPAAARRDLI
jgi:hypothetical protein